MNRTFMSMKFVDQDGKPVSMVFIEVELIPKKKNSYYMYGKTDLLGKLCFTESGCTRAIERENKEFPMDYAGRLEDICRVTVELNSEKSLLKRLESVREVWPVRWAEYVEMMHGMTNSKFVPFSVSGDVSEFTDRTIVLDKVS